MKIKKLVTDKAPSLMKRDGMPFTAKRIKGRRKQLEALIDKLFEEVGEFKKDLSANELADIKNVILHMEGFVEYSDLERLREDKLALKGGFTKFYVVKFKKSDLKKAQKAKKKGKNS